MVAAGGVTSTAVAGTARDVDVDAVAVADADTVAAVDVDGSRLAPSGTFFRHGGTRTCRVANSPTVDPC